MMPTATANKGAGNKVCLTGKYFFKIKNTKSDDVVIMIAPLVVCLLKFSITLNEFRGENKRKKPLSQKSG